MPQARRSSANDSDTAGRNRPACAFVSRSPASDSEKTRCPSLRTLNRKLLGPTHPASSRIKPWPTSGRYTAETAAKSTSAAIVVRDMRRSCTGIAPALLLLSRFRRGAERLGPPPENHFDLPAEEAHHPHTEAPVARALAVLRARLRRRAEDAQHVGLGRAFDDPSRAAVVREQGRFHDPVLQSGAETARRKLSRP